MSKLIPKLAVSVAALGLLGIRVAFPGLQIDAVALGLLVLALAPWFTSLVQTVELPGGVKVSLREIESAGAKIQSKSSSEDQRPPSKAEAEPVFVRLAADDPNIALVVLRVEIEKRVRALAGFHGLPERTPLRSLVNALRSQGVLDARSASGLDELIIAGNRAAHGAEVERAVATWAMEEGPRVLATLESELRSHESSALDGWLDRALTIIEFEGPEFAQVCATLLAASKRDGGRITLGVGAEGDKDRARATLERLEALAPVGDDISPRWGIHYRLTSKGEALLASLKRREFEPS